MYHVFLPHILGAPPWVRGCAHLLRGPWCTTGVRARLDESEAQNSTLVGERNGVAKVDTVWKSLHASMNQPEEIAALQQT